ncbi:GLPGLI family protein [Kaistella flava (ex Peng et al. 2021)]|uniref:GLPGLI family protein n=1 Tax=Kaistella flava (ex Peng et al. 2021) TaxID=2038776 RepID=A0A7M2YAA0_9FLAO|nr:GLPGLI family protein [Kaistella flava (ex Peng et al. 2021)]QOW11197.1 GLPGLI family protein [Kaistella flava (ex Peng et al. 2021)]
MKKIAILVLGICSQIVFSQANRFVYQVTMKPDSTDRNVIKTETANLDISGANSIFYAENRMKRDSILSRARQTGSFNFDRSQMQGLRSNLDFIIEKDYKTGKKIYKAGILRDQYAYEEDRPMDWKILPETATIGEYKTQKAETKFAGRTWYAWFTTEVPFQDGPYKFSGLPGLIVKVEDAKGDYSFDLKEAKKIDAIASFDQRGSIITVKRAAFEKQQEQFRKDPMAAMASMSSGGGRGGFRIQMDPNQRKRMEDRQKEEFKKNNNPIELK